MVSSTKVFQIKLQLLYYKIAYKIQCLVYSNINKEISSIKS